MELEILFVGLATGFAAGVGLTTWWSMRAVRAERRGERTRPVVVLMREGSFAPAPAWSGYTITVTGTAREVVPAVTVEGPATEREPDTKRSGR
mgnify:CR=1 FL=1